MAETSSSRTVWIEGIPRRVIRSKPGAAEGGARVQVTAAVHKRLATIQLKQPAPQNLNVALLNIVVSYRHRCALLEFASADVAQNFVVHCNQPAPPLQLMGTTVEVSLATVAYDSTVQCHDIDEVCRVAAVDCVNAIVRELEKQEAEENRLRRLERKRLQRKLLKELAASCKDVVSDDVCWDFVKHGRCKRGDKCRFVHDTQATIADIPVPLRLYSAEADTFPAPREGHAEKQRVNDAIVTTSAGLANKRCLVLDGAHCMSTRALRACPIANRTQSDIVSPNSCTETYLAIRERAECLAFHGSLRAFIDCNARAPQASDDEDVGQTCRDNCVHNNHCWIPARRLHFGVAYLDYCSSLYAGRGKDVEKSPLDDIAGLFARQTLDPRGALLVITLAVAREGPAQVLADLASHVTTHAGRVNLVATATKCFEFDTTVTQFFSLLSAHAGSTDPRSNCVPTKTD